MPVFYRLISLYPTPAALAAAQHDDVVAIFAHLGLQNQRAKRVVEMAKAWVEQPPERGRRYRRLNYPMKGDGRDVKVGEVLVDEKDEEVKEEEEAVKEGKGRVGWEVAHLPGVGAYGLDSWRIFCRDELRGIMKGDVDEEWRRVVPLDKELRAYLRWSWLKEGWVWDPLTGKKREAGQKEMKDAEDGGVIVEGDEGDVVESKEEVEDVVEDVKGKKRKKS